MSCSGFQLRLNSPYYLLWESVLVSCNFPMNIITYKMKISSTNEIHCKCFMFPYYTDIGTMMSHPLYL